ncbi:DUSTY-like protein [Mya arenaria]|uniref:DUSTY-like protein n=1 Tax=Mya arenaria TaxID=6604 RepID=A0ABY7G3R0_MYAAR|nr:DUSTY-like protein [Mya arenaria]
MDANLSPEDVQNMDMKSVVALAKEMDIDITGDRTKDKIVNKIIDIILKRKPDPDPLCRPDGPSLMKASDDHAVVRRKLQEKIRQAHKLYQAFPLKLKSNLTQSYPRLEDDFKEKQNSLKNGECWILVAEDLKGIQEFKDSVVECDENDDNPFERVELYYPFKTLSKEVVIVDTPGIEGGNNVDQSLEVYLKKSFGFLYVINTNAAGGVQQGRLGHLLKTVVNCSEDFSPEASLFIGNKWENVPDKDKGDVQREAREFYLNHKDQIKDHTMLQQKMGQLIPSSLRQGLINHYWWLSGFLTRSNYVLRVTSVQHEMTEEETRQRYMEMKKHVEELQRNSDDCVGNLRKKVDFEIFKITGHIKDLLQHPRGCPKSDRKWKRTADDAAMIISERIAMVIDSWQREHSVLSKIDKEIIDVFSKEFGLLQHQVDDIEKFLADSKGKAMMLKTVKLMPVKGIFAKKKGKVERTYSTMGGAVSCIGMLDTGKKNVRKLFKDRYTDKVSQNQRAAVMAEATTLYIKSILEHKDMNSKLRKYFDRFFKDIDEAAKRIPEFLKADQQLIETLRNSMTEIEQLKEKLPSLCNDCADMHGELDIFYINNIMKFDYDISEFDWHGKQPLGSGSFADVFRSEIVANEAVSRKNVTDILTEDRTMRDLRHPNVVRYYGATFRKDPDKGLIWIMIAKEGTAKITDVGVAKPTKILVRTCEGSPAYMAPEVLLGSQNHTNKIDIYSLSFIYWEMWFGQEITADMNREILGRDFYGDAMEALKKRQGNSKGGWRPSFSKANKPQDEIVELLKKMWSVDPNERPSAIELIYDNREQAVDMAMRILL